MRIGVLGGSFNPFHLGHLAMAEAARDRHGLERVLVVPARDPPHKSQRGLAPAAERLAMVQKAVDGIPALTASDIEIGRPGPSYSVDTLAEIGRRWPGAEIFLIVGEDTYAEMGTWHQARRVFELARVAIVTRPDRHSGEGSAPEGLPVELLQPCDRDRVEMDPVAISSTEVRRRVAVGQPLDGWVPDVVARHIAQQGLYRGGG